MAQDRRACPTSRIIRIATSDNFWAMGETGPCGPCSEIFYDHGDKIPGGPPGSADAEGDRFVEIWNLVFMQYEQAAADKRVPLAASVDRHRHGARAHRRRAPGQARQLRHRHPARADRSPRPKPRMSRPTGRRRSRTASSPIICAPRSFLIADGVLPAKEGRGYVLRRIMRRAMRHAHILGAEEPLMWRLVPALVRQMGAAYPELVRAEALITETLKLEETELPARRSARGLKLLDEEEVGLPKGKAFPGEVAFKLYDTFGFPLDLTEDVLRGRGRKVATKAFDHAMERQRAEARKSWVGSGEAATDPVWLELREKLGATEFLGYEASEAEGAIQAIVVDGKQRQRGQGRHRGRDHRQPDAVLRRIRRPDGRHRRDVFGQGRRIRGFATRQKRAGELFAHLGKVAHGALKRGRRGRAPHRRRAARRAARQSFGHPSAASGAAPPPRRRM